MKILITGGSGFIGKPLAQRLLREKHSPRIVVRGPENLFNDSKYFVQIDNITANTDWKKSLEGCSIVVHLAALVHKNSYSDEAYIKTNVDSTINLARQSALAGVERFIYLSSIGVNGKLTQNDSPFTVFDKEQPHDSYSRSKYEAEIKLKKLSRESDLNVVIIRPPLVYGKDAPGNISKLFKLIDSRIPLPFSSIDNIRSFVSLRNLVDLIIVCCNHPNALNKTFLVSDDRDISTPEFIKKLGLANNKPVQMFKMPLQLLKIIAFLLGKAESLSSLCNSLQVDISYTKEKLNWSPRYKFNEEFLDSHKNN